jgi:hypothetical protein
MGFTMHELLLVLGLVGYKAPDGGTEETWVHVLRLVSAGQETHEQAHCDCSQHADQRVPQVGQTEQVKHVLRRLPSWPKIRDCNFCKCVLSVFILKVNGGGGVRCVQTGELLGRTP